MRSRLISLRCSVCGYKEVLHEGGGEGQKSQDSQVSTVGPGRGKLCNHCGCPLLRVPPALMACEQGLQAVLNV